MRLSSLCWEAGGSLLVATSLFSYTIVTVDTLNPEEARITQPRRLRLSVRQTDFSFPALFIIFQTVARISLAMKDYTKLF